MKLSKIYFLFLLLFLIAGCISKVNQDIALGSSEDGANPIGGSIPKEKVQMKEEINVVIENFEYIPSEIRIKKGVTVKWTQKDSVRHTVTSDDGIFDSGLLSEGDTWSYKFNEEGIYSYYCIPHPNMKGKVIVE